MGGREEGAEGGGGGMVTAGGSNSQRFNLVESGASLNQPATPSPPVSMNGSSDRNFCVFWEP